MSSDECIDNAVSMVEVLEEEEQLEKDATAVLGDGDLHNCTYDMVSIYYCYWSTLTLAAYTKFISTSCI